MTNKNKQENKEFHSIEEYEEYYYPNIYKEIQVANWSRILDPNKFDHIRNFLNRINNISGSSPL